MARVSQMSSLNKILLVVFGIAFGIVLLALGYKGVKTSNEMRSRAAQDKVEYKRWDFTNDTEGWTGTNVNSLSVSGGSLSAVVGQGSNFSSPVGTISLPKGNKYIEFRMGAVSKDGTLVLGDWTDGSDAQTTPGTGSSVDQPNQKRIPADCTETENGDFTCPGGVVGHVSTQNSQDVINYWTAERQAGAKSGSKDKCTPKPPCETGKPCVQLQYYPQGGWCEDVTANPATRNMTISVSVDGDSTYKDLSVSVPVNGTMNDYTLKLSQIDQLSVNQIGFFIASGVDQGDKVYIDSIRLVGQAVSGDTKSCPMDAKQCPDGSTVGRIGPNCEFVPCKNDTVSSGGTQTTAPKRKPQTACTEDAKICPDGSTVGRVGPNCEFAPCPGKTTLSPPSDTVHPCPMDAKRCPDGSTVGRIGISCQFDACPPTDSNITPPPRPCPMDAKRCPDGSTVGRSGPGCTFDVCDTKPVQPVTWDVCVKTPGSTILETNPQICVMRDGKRITGSSNSIQPFVRWFDSVNSFFSGIFGISK